MSTFLNMKRFFSFFIFFLICVSISFTQPPQAHALFEKFIYGNVFIDSNENQRKDAGEKNYTGPITITAAASGSMFGNSTSVSTTLNGTYTVLVDNGSGATVRVSYPSRPANYIMTYPLNNPPSITVGLPGILDPCILGGSPDAYCQQVGILDEYIFNLNFAMVPPYSVAGNVFIDANKNGIKDAGETNYIGPFTITSTAGTVTTTGTGTYTVNNLRAGSVTVSYPSLPAGYLLTYPLNGPPPSFTVSVGSRPPGCNTNGASGAICSNNNINNLNFGITNLTPWFQSTCGDVRVDSGINDAIPSTAVGGSYLITTNASCLTPGVAYTGDSSYSLRQGQISSKNWVAGGSTSPEVHKTANASGISSSYAYLLTKAQRANLIPIDLASVCTLTNCTLPANLAHGIYKANGDVKLNAFSFPANQNYVILINGNLTLQGAVSVPIGSTAIFSASGNITVPATLGVAANNMTPSLQGIYSTDKSFITDTAGNCNDLRLNIAGTVITNAALQGGSFQNKRDLCANDSSYPVVSFQQRLDFFFNLPDIIRIQNTTSQEVAP